MQRDHRKQSFDDPLFLYGSDYIGSLDCLRRAVLFDRCTFSGFYGDASEGYIYTVRDFLPRLVPLDKVAASGGTGSSFQVGSKRGSFAFASNKEESKMLLWLKYYASSSDKASEMVDKAIKELKNEHERYLSVPFRRVNVDFEINQCQRIFMNKVPCIYAEQELLFEYEPGMSYAVIKAGVARAMDRFLADSIL